MVPGENVTKFSRTSFVVEKLTLSYPQNTSRWKYFCSLRKQGHLGESVRRYRRNLSARPTGLTTILRFQRRAARDAKRGWKSRENEKQDGGRSEGWSWHSRQLNAIMALIIVGRRRAGIVLSTLDLRWPCWIHPLRSALGFPLYNFPHLVAVGTKGS